MQCPNCGKEAINVNGRYVCLDCGIELDANNQTASAPEPTVGATVDNHTQLPTGSTPPIAGYNPNPLGPADSSTNISAASDAVAATDPTPTITPDPTPLSPEAQTPVPTGMTTQPEPVASTEAATPEMPAPSLTPEEPVAPPATPAAPTMDYNAAANMVLGDSAASTPTEPATPEVAAEPEKPAEPVKDYFVSALNEENETPNEASAAGGVLPDFPAGDSMAATAPEVPAVPTDALPETPTIDADGVSATPDMPAPDAPKEEPATYFQPESFDIGNQAAAPVSEPAAPTADTPPITMPEPAPEVVLPETETPTPEPTVPEVPEAPSLTPGETEIPINVGAPPAAPVASDVSSEVVDPLDSVSPEAVSTPNETAPVAPVPETQAQGTDTFPGAGSIPSTESVFGPAAASESPNVTPKKKNLLWLWIILGTLGVLLLAGGGYYGYTMFTAGSGEEEGGEETPGEILSISQDVAGVMDETTDIAATFEQTLDFSKAATTNNALAEAFKAPILLKETWAVDNEGDISLIGSIGSVETKRTYIKADSGTYVYSADTKSWVKAEGVQLSPSSIFFPIESRGGLFYLSRVESMVADGEDEVGGVKAQKIKVVPKATAIQELLTAANPNFANIKYNEINVTGLTVTAWVNAENQVLKITVSGAVEVDSDLYTGPVTITASGTYKYAEQKVTKP